MSEEKKYEDLDVGEQMTEEQREALKKVVTDQSTKLGEVFSQCWESKEFKQAFMEDPKAIFEEYGINTPNCGACLSNMAVTPGGNVVPCQSWLSGSILGDMLKDDWKSIWENEECKKRRDYSAEMTGLCPLRRTK